MSTCKACQYWTPVDEDGWGQCRLGKSTAGTAVYVTRAYGCDSDHYSAHLKTRFDFGCVQFVNADWLEPKAEVVE